MREKKFKIRVTAEFIMKRPEDWTEDILRSQILNGSYCLDNWIMEYEEYIEERLQETGECSCGDESITFKFLGEVE